LIKFVSKDSVLKVLKQRVSPKLLAVNQKALELGISIAKEVGI
jgi:Pyruvate/2-oxoacid:ferredoxin oxidoreductase gamma subunit